MESRATAFLDAVLSNFRTRPKECFTLDCSSGLMSRDVVRSRCINSTAPTLYKRAATHLPCSQWTIPQFKDLARRLPNSPLSVARNNVEQEVSAVEDLSLVDLLDKVERLCSSTDRNDTSPGTVASVETDEAEAPPVLPPSQYLYLNQNLEFFTTHFPELLEDMKGFVDLFPRSVSLEPSLWLGPTGTVTGLHCDLDHNTLIHIWGKKTFILIPRHQSELMYPSPKYDMGAHLSQVDLRKVGYNRKHFPRVAEATPYVAHLEPGDMISIPQGWYHFVYGTRGPVLSVTMHANTARTAIEEKGKYMLHLAGLYGWKNGCTCHTG
eukprot:TRINITY_DN80023_c0_g1_i1.p1 TRINITY_DN80023_c0_g1~~TRINITY_DN80023_c0_g1_i1.p1  ORF type:complete len:323 (+),score=44.14 TRINITY_DN80023_c0_g1_i1:32-1000(+)